MHDADDLVRSIGFDKAAMSSVEGRRGVARHPVAIGRQQIDRKAFSKDYIVERGLFDIEKPGALGDLRDHARPGIPMRSVVMERENAAIEDRIAAEPVRHAPPKGLAIAFPAE